MERTDQNQHRESVMRWAKTTERYVDDVRNGTITPPSGQDIPTHIKNYVLESIAGDDANAFTQTYGSFEPNETPLDKEVLLTRLDFEIDLAETPEKVRSRLQKMRNKVGKANFSDESQYMKIIHEFKEKVVKPTRKDLESDPSYKSTFLK